MRSGLTVVIAGAGAREHAIAMQYLKSPQIGKVIVTPGNKGMEYLSDGGIITDPDCNLKNLDSLNKAILRNNPDIADIAQDDAIATGIVDSLRQRNIATFGPTKSAAKLEWDKFWSREFMRNNDIPHPNYIRFSQNQIPMAKHHLETTFADAEDKTVFIKASGLCAGKGALKATNYTDAVMCVDAMQSFGPAGDYFLIEEALTGNEFSSYAVLDGIHFARLPSAMDYKRALDNDKGNQTGGMGALTPTSVTNGIEDKVTQQQVEPVLKGMLKECHPYTGFLYIGGMLAKDGSISTIEFNSRMGDPEAQVIVPGINDYFGLVNATILEQLHNFPLKTDGIKRFNVVGASTGYPNDYSQVKGKKVFGIADALNVDGVEIFSAGIDVQDDYYIANGGRLFSVVGKGTTLKKAAEMAYEAISRIHIEGVNNLHYRNDIGKYDLAREAA